MEQKQIIADFTDKTCVAVYGLDQWDREKEIKITGLDLPENVEVHFSLQEIGGTAQRVEGTTVDGVTTAKIPQFILEGDETPAFGTYYRAYAFIYVVDGTSAETVRKIIFYIESRPRPEDYIYTETEVKTWTKLEERIGDIEKNGTNAVLKYPLTIKQGDAEISYDGSGAVTVTFPDGKLTKVEKLATDTTLEMDGDFTKYYVFPEMEELTVTGEGDFFFQSGETPTTLTLEDTVKVPDSFTVESNKVYEINILNGCMTYQSWAVE